MTSLWRKSRVDGSSGFNHSPVRTTPHDRQRSAQVPLRQLCEVVFFASAWTSEELAPIPSITGVPQAEVSPSITVTGSRVGSPIEVSGTTVGFGWDGTLRPWLRCLGQTLYSEGSTTILTDIDGTFKRVHVRARRCRSASRHPTGPCGPTSSPFAESHPWVAGVVDGSESGPAARTPAGFARRAESGIGVHGHCCCQGEVVHYLLAIATRKRYGSARIALALRDDSPHHLYIGIRGDHHPDVVPRGVGSRHDRNRALNSGRRCRDRGPRLRRRRSRATSRARPGCVRQLSVGGTSRIRGCGTVWIRTGGRRTRGGWSARLREGLGV
jgi:hypothetical protein